MAPYDLCHHYGCRLDCPLAPWNFEERFLARAPRSDHKYSFLRRYIMYLKDLWPTDLVRDPMFVYTQSRAGLGWLDSKYGLPPLY